MGCGGGRSYLPFPYPTTPAPAPAERQQSTKDILKTRLAEGEITVEEYLEMLRVLEGDTSPRPQKKTSHIRMP